MLTLADTKQLIQDKGVEFFLCSFVEMSGAPKAKLVPATHVDDMASGSAGFAGFATGEMGQGPHSPDMIAMPDFNTTTILPWRKNIAWVASNIYVNNAPWPYCPRTVLSRYLERVQREWGYTYKIGIEPEFHLVQQDADGRWRVYDRLDTLAKPCYDLRALHRNLDIMTTLVQYMQEMGWDPYANDHEDANCQFETNFTYADALTTADRHTFLKWMVKTVAEQHGLVATFMPKPFAHLTGNGAHFHMSLWDAARDVNLFEDARDELGLSQLAYHFCGGLMKHAQALAAITNPLVNSYKRLIRGAPNSGATWAPVYVTYGGSNRTQMIRIPGPGRIENRIIDGATWAPVYVTYGGSNRTQMIRIPGPGRIENRIIDGAANPYLAATVLLAAGLDGVQHRLDPGAKNVRNLYEVPEEVLHKEGIAFLPTTLKDALDHFEADEVVCGALGAEYAEMYIRAKRQEWNAYHRSVSQWELDNYITVY